MSSGLDFFRYIHATQRTQESDMSFLSTVAKDAKAVLAFLGSSRGQTIIQTGEAVAESLAPALTGIITIANNGLAEILKVETISSAAAQQTGSGSTKAAAVISALTPEILAWAKANGQPIPDSATIQKATDGLVAFLNAFGEPTASAPASAAPTK